MIDTSRLTVFVLAALILALTPGPAVLFIIARSIQRGRSAGIASALGVAVGSILQICMASLGISALLLASTTAYSILKWLGAGYLVYLGLRALLSREASPLPKEDLPLSGGLEIVRSGVLVNLLNPKTALFFLSFLPQFVSPGRGPVWSQTMILGALFVGIAACTDSLYALLSGSLRGLLNRRTGLVTARRWVSGGIYIGLGVAAALSGARPAK